MQHLIADMLLLANADARGISLQINDAAPDDLLLCVYENMKTWLLPRGFPCSFPLGMRLSVTARWIRSASHRFCPFLWTMHCLIPHRGEKVLLLLSQSAHHTIFAVADDGPSIPEEEKAHIFERFYRTNHAHTDHDHFGLGLCTAQEIVRAHHGKILVHDPRDCSPLPEGFPRDRGVVFTVVLHG